MGGQNSPRPHGYFPATYIVICCVDTKKSGGEMSRETEEMLELQKFVDDIDQELDPNARKVAVILLAATWFVGHGL
jgi:hypothetical protein